MSNPVLLSRRHLLGGVSAAALSARLPGASADPVPALPATAAPLPLRDVELLPSIWRDAMLRNRDYVLGLDPDRLLHNFRTQAGLPAKGAAYGGWESDTIAGHTLGHYLSALSLLHAQTGDAGAVRRVSYVVDELALVQRAQGDGYVAGFTRRDRDGSIVPGKVIFAEIAAGQIRSSGFDLNGAWSPLYNLHKTFAGLLDAQALCGNSRALPVAVGLAGYLERVFARLDDAQMQDVLSCEYGGLNESFAELALRTGDRRWLVLAGRIYDRKVLDPLARRVDDLPNIHANTQIPKLIGLARIRDVGGDPAREVAPRFFWDTVTRHHSYVIGGNADREYFSAPDTIAAHITEQTCEHCNSYNMLKLTRQIYGWQPDAALFDFYERTHLNHVLAAQNARTAMFTYMTPVLSGAVREWSTPTADFWCCVGTGMESHAKHGDSVFWEGGDTLLVNLFIPVRAQWRRHRAEFELLTGYPAIGTVRLTLAKLPAPRRFAVALRIPGWVGASPGLRASVNGVPVPAEALSSLDRGYLLLRRVWHAGDRVELDLPLLLRTESPSDDPRLVSVLRGPAVLAADLGPSGNGAPFAGVSPALVTADVVADLRPAPDDPVAFLTDRSGRPDQLRFVPFHAQDERRSAVYLPRFTDAEWAAEQRDFLAEQQRQRDIAARSVDVLHLGEMQGEHDHGLSADNSFPTVYRGRNGRDLRSGGFIAFRMKLRPGPMLLQYTSWSGDRGDGFTVRVDGAVLAVVPPPVPEATGRFVDATLPMPQAVTANRRDVLVRFEGTGRHGAGPFFAVRTLQAAAPPGTATASAAGGDRRLAG